MYRYITYFEIAAFLASLIAWPKIRKINYLRWFPLLLFVIVGVEAYQTLPRSPEEYNNAWLYNWQVPLQHLLYLLILHQASGNHNIRRCLVLAAGVFIIFTVITSFLISSGEYNTLSYCVGMVFIIGGILISFYEMLQDPGDHNFLRRPFFYMLFAYLLFNVGTLPYFVMANWIGDAKPSRDLLQILANVMSVLNFILYTTYTFAFLWIRQMKVYF
jgi:hypothetical protein